MWNLRGYKHSPLVGVSRGESGAGIGAIFAVVRWGLDIGCTFNRNLQIFPPMVAQAIRWHLVVGSDGT